MSIDLIRADRDILLLFPPSVQKWLSTDHMYRFWVDIVGLKTTLGYRQFVSPTEYQVTLN